MRSGCPAVRRGFSTSIRDRREGILKFQGMRHSRVFRRFPCTLLSTVHPTPQLSSHLRISRFSSSFPQPPNPNRLSKDIVFPVKLPQLHGENLRPRPSGTPLQRLYKYSQSRQFLINGLYRALWILVLGYPIYAYLNYTFVSPNHTDGKYEAFSLVERRDLENGHSFFILKRKKEFIPWWIYWIDQEIPDITSTSSRTPIVSLKIQNPTSEIERSYTPLNLSPNEIHLLIKRFPNGELSRFLHFLAPGIATVWVKQGRQEWIYNEGEWDHVIFIVGGTGVTPAYQLCSNALLRQRLRKEVDEDFKMTKFSVLASARDVKNVLLRDEFGELKKEYGDRLNVTYFVDKLGKENGPDDIILGPINEDVVKDTVRTPKGWLKWRTEKVVKPEGKKVMVLVCGTDGFTRYVAGEHGGVVSKQGVKGGLLKNVEGIELFKMLETPNEMIVDDPSGRYSRGPPIMKIDH
jgi:ferredoxin-NADP reductase